MPLPPAYTAAPDDDAAAADASFLVAAFEEAEAAAVDVLPFALPPCCDCRRFRRCSLDHISWQSMTEACMRNKCA